MQPNLCAEAQIEKSVIQRMVQNCGVFIPPDVVPGRRANFAVDNIDFKEDTPDCKRTLHGTAMAVYQKKDPEDVTPVLRFFLILYLTGIVLSFPFSSPVFLSPR